MSGIKHIAPAKIYNGRYHYYKENTFDRVSYCLNCDTLKLHADTNRDSFCEFCGKERTKSIYIGRWDTNKKTWELTKDIDRLK